MRGAPRSMYRHSGHNQSLCIALPRWSPPNPSSLRGEPNEEAVQPFAIGLLRRELVPNASNNKRLVDSIPPWIETSLGNTTSPPNPSTNDCGSKSVRHNSEVLSRDRSPRRASPRACDNNRMSSTSLQNHNRRCHLGTDRERPFAMAHRCGAEKVEALEGERDRLRKPPERLSRSLCASKIVSSQN
jgi:hypothetical protein